MTRLALSRPATPPAATPAVRAVAHSLGLTADAAPFRRLANRATMAAVALAVVLGAAVPARAGDDALAKAVVAALIIGAIAHQAGKADAAPPPVEPAQPVHGTRPWPPHHPPQHPPQGGWHPPQHPPYHPPAYHPPRPAPQPQWRARLPYYCAIDIDARGGARRVFSESCLRREGVSLRLPRHCATEARIWGRWDRVYGADCLRMNGYDVGGRR